MTKNWTPQAMPKQTGKIALITGGNSGLGYYSALHLARTGARVVLACRNATKGQKAQQALLRTVNQGQIELMTLDLADLASIEAFARAFTLKYGRLDILLNNAGVMFPAYEMTKNGFELQFGTNHLGHYALTGQLLPLLLRTVNSRVVTISSLAARTGAIHFDDLMWTSGYKSMAAYAQSKLANLMFGLSLHDKLVAAEAKVASIIAHPGVSNTQLMANSNLNGLLRGLSGLVMPLIGQSAERGAWPQLYAATEAQSGMYIGPSGFGELKGHPALAQIPKQAMDLGARHNLWTVSEELTGVKFLI